MSLVVSKTTLQSAYPESDARNAKLLDFARAQGFAIAGQGGGWKADVFDYEGEDLKDALRAEGFKDCDFSLFLEYRRSFGFL